MTKPATDTYSTTVLTATIANTGDATAKFVTNYATYASQLPDGTTVHFNNYNITLTNGGLNPITVPIIDCAAIVSGGNINLTITLAQPYGAGLGIVLVVPDGFYLSAPTAAAGTTSACGVTATAQKITLSWVPTDYDPSADKVVVLACEEQENVWHEVDQADKVGSTYDFNIGVLDLQAKPNFVNPDMTFFDNAPPPAFRWTLEWQGRLWGACSKDALVFDLNNIGVLNITNQDFDQDFPIDDLTKVSKGVAALVWNTGQAYIFNGSEVGKRLYFTDASGVPVGSVYVVDAVIDAFHVRLAETFTESNTQGLSAVLVGPSGLFCTRNDSRGANIEAVPPLNNFQPEGFGVDEILAGVPFGENLALFTQRAIVIAAGGQTTGMPSLQWLNPRPTGVTGPLALAKVTESRGSAFAEDIIFASQQGLFTLSGGNLVNLTDNQSCRGLWRTITPASLKTAVAQWDAMNGVFVLSNLNLTTDANGTPPYWKFLYDVNYDACYLQSYSPVTCALQWVSETGEIMFIEGDDFGNLNRGQLVSLQSRDVHLEDATEDATVSMFRWSGVPWIIGMGWQSVELTEPAVVNGTPIVQALSATPPTGTTAALTGSFIFFKNASTGAVVARRIVDASTFPILRMDAGFASAPDDYTFAMLGAIPLEYVTGILGAGVPDIKQITALRLMLGGPTTGTPDTAWLARMRLWMAGVERNIATITANASGDLSIPLNKTLAGCRALPLPGLASQSFVAGLDALVLDEDWRLAQLSIDNKVIRGSALS